MRKVVGLPLAALALAMVGAAALALSPIGAKPNLSALEGKAERGAYLARMAGCIACHTDAENGGAPLAGGVALATDFGTFYSPNLTTDLDHGIGTWTMDEFAQAVRQGISPDGAPYYPAFPYPFYTKLTNQDVADLWAAFQTVPPVDEPSKEQDMQFPFNVRAGLKIWRAFYLDGKPFQSNKEKSEMWNRGKYIVEGPAHCAACHTPRNVLGARQIEQELHGAEGLPGGEESPPITAVQLRERGWTISTLRYALRTGVMPDGDVFGGSMGEVVKDGTSFLSDDDLTAIANYLLDVE